MSHDRKYRMTGFQKGLYRHHINCERQWEAKRAKSVGGEAVVTRLLPLDIAGIVRPLRVHTTFNRGEGAEQALRVIAELDDHGAKGVMMVTIDRLYGLVEFRFRYKDVLGERGGEAWRLGSLHRTDRQPYVLALYRLCELLDAQAVNFIAEALAQPEGAGFPKFTKEGSRDLIQCMGGADVAVRSGVPKGLKDGQWYAMKRKPLRDDPKDALCIYVGQAFTRQRGPDDWHFRERGISVTAENDGYGRVTPSPEYRCHQPWLEAFHGKIFPWYEARLEKLRDFVCLPFHGTPALMAECLKTV